MAVCGFDDLGSCILASRATCPLTAQTLVTVEYLTVNMKKKLLRGDGGVVS